MSAYPTPTNRLYEALAHGGIANSVEGQLNWIIPKSSSRTMQSPRLEECTAILVPGGFGERGSEGKIAAVRFARERKVPFFGICFGMQMASSKARGDLAGIRSARSTEFGPAEHPVVGLMTEWMRGNEVERARRESELGGTMRLGAYDACCAGQPGARDLWRQDWISERHRHRYEVNINYKRAARRRRGYDFRASHPMATSGDRRVPRPPLVHRRAVPSRAQDPSHSTRIRCFAAFIAAAVDQSRLV